MLSSISSARTNPWVSDTPNPILTPALRQLFHNVPKTELHCHLSGSVPLPLLQTFMQENGVSADQIQTQSALKPQYRDLDDFLDSYYRVAGQVKNPDQFRRAAAAIVLEAAKDNVRYLEIRSSILARDGQNPEIRVKAIEAGIKEGMSAVEKLHGYKLSTRLIVLAQRAGTPAESLESAEWAVRLSQQPGSLICGFDLAGSEGSHSVEKHAEALRYVKVNGLPLTVHAGETPVSEGISGSESVKAALALGSNRIGHGLQSMRDPALVAELSQQQIPIELCPLSNVQISSVDQFKQLPLQSMLQKKLNVSLSSDNRTITSITMRDQLGQLYANGLLPCWEQIKTLTLNGVRGAFLPELDKARLNRDILQQFVVLEVKYRTLINAVFCKQCDHPRALNLQNSHSNEVNKLVNPFQKIA